MKQKKRLFWQLFSSYLLITVLALAAMALYVSESVEACLSEHSAADLAVRAHLAADRVAEKLDPGADAAGRAKNERAIDGWCKELGKKTEMRITVIRPDGTVIGESQRSPVGMKPHRDRPEVVEALQQGEGSRERYSKTLKEDMMYMAVRIPADGEAAAVVRVARPLTRTGRSLAEVYRRIALSGAVAAGAAALVCLVVSRVLSRPLEEMTRGAERFAAGDLTARLASPTNLEMSGLAETLNQMAAELDERIQTIVRQRNEQEAILGALAEGVLVVDADECVIGINRAAADLLDVDPEEAKQRSVQEAVGNPELQEFVARALAAPGPIQGDVPAGDGAERRLQVCSAVLRDADEQRIGAVIVMNDVTRSATT